MTNGSTSVTLAYRLVDATTGTELWTNEQTVTDSSGGGNWAEAMVSAGIHAMSNMNNQREVKLAALANQQVIHDPGNGMLVGGYHKDHAADQQRRKNGGKPPKRVNAGDA